MAVPLAKVDTEYPTRCVPGGVAGDSPRTPALTVIVMQHGVELSMVPSEPSIFTGVLLQPSMSTPEVQEESCFPQRSHHKYVALQRTLSLAPPTITKIDVCSPPEL